MKFLTGESVSLVPWSVNWCFLTTILLANQVTVNNCNPNPSPILTPYIPPNLNLKVMSKVVLKSAKFSTIWLFPSGKRLFLAARLTTSSLQICREYVPEVKMVALTSTGDQEAKPHVCKLSLPDWDLFPCSRHGWRKKTKPESLKTHNPGKWVERMQNLPKEASVSEGVLGGGESSIQELWELSLWHWIEDTSWTLRQKKQIQTLWLQEKVGMSQYGQPGTSSEGGKTCGGPQGTRVWGEDCQSTGCSVQFNFR